MNGRDYNLENLSSAPPKPVWTRLLKLQNLLDSPEVPFEEV
jgi:hypothetical protein